MGWGRDYLAVSIERALIMATLLELCVRGKTCNRLEATERKLGRWHVHGVLTSKAGLELDG